MGAKCVPKTLRDWHGIKSYQNFYDVHAIFDLSEYLVFSAKLFAYFFNPLESDFAFVVDIECLEDIT